MNKIKYPSKNLIINIDHVYCLNSLWNAIKTQQLLGVPVLLEGVFWEL